MDAKQIFEILVRENAQMLTAYIRSVSQDATLADDIWQETMLVAWRRIGEFDSTRPFGPWLRGIAAKLMLAARRKRAIAHQRESLLGDEEALDYLNQRFHQVQQLQGDTLDEKLEALRDCVVHLSPAEQECVTLRFTHDMMPAQLSERLNVALETVKKRLVRARQKLATCLAQKLTVSEAQL